MKLYSPTIFLFFFILIIFTGCSHQNISKNINITIKNTSNPNFNNITFFNINSSTNQKTNNISNYWIPKIKSTWQIQLDGKLNLKYNVSFYDIDLFDTPTKIINDLHKRGIKVICYFSAGTYENWRNDSTQFPKNILGNNVDGWPGERWLNIAKYSEFKTIMINRLNLAKQKGCDGVDPDNLDAFNNINTGFNITYQQQLNYNKWLAKEAHSRNLSIGLKNDLTQIKDLVHYFDFAINEQCFQYNECNNLIPFIKNNKAVFNIEYSGNFSKICNDSIKLNLSTLFMKINLNGNYRKSCIS